MEAGTAAALTSLVTFAVAAGSPGPATLAVAGTSMAAGRGAGLAMGLGLGVGLTFWGVLTALGMGYLIASYASALLILKLCGAAFLFYLAYTTGRAALRPARAAPVTQAAGARRLFLRGLLLNLLNPKAIFAWVAALALGAPDAWIVMACAMTGFVLYAGYALIFSLGPVRAAYARTARWIDGVCAVIFAYAGFRLLLWRAD